jgi:hypothetical protein
LYLSALFYIGAACFAILALEGVTSANSVPSYLRDSQLREAAAWWRFGMGVGGMMTALFAGYVCQKLHEIAEALKPSDVVSAISMTPQLENNGKVEDMKS